MELAILWFTKTILNILIAYYNNNISYICTRISRNIGIIFDKYTFYLMSSLSKFIAILECGNNYNSHLEKVQIKQN